jgi:hypothetical protein
MLTFHLGVQHGVDRHFKSSPLRIVLAFDTFLQRPILAALLRTATAEKPR